MSRYLIFMIGSAVLVFAVDYYVFRNWRRYARSRRKLRWTLPVYTGLMVLMPFAVPVYLSLTDWWSVEPKLLRGLLIGFWVTYYLPKALIALVLVAKDLAWFVTWLFAWFKQRLRPDAAAEPGLDLTDMKRMTRGDFLRTMGWTAGAVPFVVVGYGVFRSLYDFALHRVDLPVAGLPRALDGLTIAQLSDLHAGSFFSDRPMREAVEAVNALRPGLVAVTGDFVNHDAAELDVIEASLRGLQAELGVFGCLGNHDHYARVDAVARRVRATGLDLLVNAHRTVAVDGARLHVVGTDNTGFRQHYADLPRALDGLPADDGDAFRLLLAHDPTFWDTHVRPAHPEIDLMLCGHTHGGQIGLEVGPFRWSLARPVYDRWAGLYAEPRDGGAGRPQHLYVNRGLGTVGPPVRLGIRPEITLITLRRA